MADSSTSLTSSRRVEAPASSSSGAHHDIFLSHSGVQKAFVKDLYRMLNPPYTPFFDITHHSLPPGESFPKRIFEATKACKLAVVILSHEFLLSKWPMIELCDFVKVVPSVKILPVFYKLTPENLKHPSNVRKWHKAWKAHAKNDPTKRIVVSDWEQALRHLISLNGPVFRPSDQGEGAYLEEIVSSIYEIFPKALKYEDWDIHGKDRLCEIILAKFRKLDSTALQPCILGMYGLPGTGKSTLSRCLCDHFFPCFHGWSFYLELPTNPTHDQLLNKSKELLRNLPGCHNMVNLTSNASDIRQVYHLFKTSRLPMSKVFLVVDNISSQESVDFVQHLLMLAGFRAGSKVLLVARTLDVLQPLLQILRKKSHYVCDSLSIPSIDETEAIKILLQSGGSGSLVEAAEEDGISPRDRQILGRVVSMSGCGHDRGRNHLIPLVLKIMGIQLRQYEFDIEKWGREIESFWKKVEVCKEDAVRQLVQQNFESLPKKLQLLFLDTALFVLPSSLIADGMSHRRRMKEACGLLSIMHESSRERIEMEMYGLRQCGFVEINHGNSLRVHDVYLEFAASIPESCMYYVQSYTEGPTSMDLSSSLDQAKASELRVIILQADEVQERLEFQASLSNVKALVLRKFKSLAKLGLAGLSSLVSLEIDNCPKLQWVDVGNDQSCLQRLKRLRWANEQDETKQMLPVQLAVGRSSILIQSAQQLSQALLPWRMSTLFSLGKHRPQRPVFGIGSFSSQCRGLQTLTLENTGIKRLQDMSMWWPHLGELRVVEQQLDHFELGSLLQLKLFFFSDGDKDFLLDSETDGQFYYGGNIYFNKYRALAGGKDLFAGCPNLEDVRMNCSKSFNVESMGTLIHASKLHTLWMRHFYSFSNLATAFPQSVERLLMSNGDIDVRNVNFTWRFGGLRNLQLYDCPGLVEVTGLDHLPSLSELEIENCEKLQTLSGLSGLVSLERFTVGQRYSCPNLRFSLSELENLARLRRLRCYSLHSVSFFNVANLVGLTDMDISTMDISTGGRVDLEGTFVGLEKLGNLHFLTLHAYRRLRSSNDENCTGGSLVDLSVLLGVPKPCHLCGLKSIYSLKLCGLQNLASLNGMEFLVTLHSLSLKDLKQLTSLQGMECLVHLERLSLKGCVSVSELPSLRALVNMCWLRIRDCVKLKAVEGCDAMTRLEEADFRGCRSLESLPLEFESIRQMNYGLCIGGRNFANYRLCIGGCKFANIDGMVAWAVDKNVPVLLRRASLKALAWEFDTNLLEKARERRELGVVILGRVAAYFLEQIFESNEEEQYCLAFAEWANLLDKLSRSGDFEVYWPRSDDIEVRRKFKEAMELLRGLANVSKRQVLQQCRSDATFQLSVVDCLAQLHNIYVYDRTKEESHIGILTIIAHSIERIVIP